MHKAKPKDERIGAWYLYAKGSGMWINLVWRARAGGGMCMYASVCVYV